MKALSPSPDVAGCDRLSKKLRVGCRIPLAMILQAVYLNGVYLLYAMAS